jgi:dUTPase
MTHSSILYLYPTSELYDLYVEKALQHNTVKKFPDAGFDLLTPEPVVFTPNTATKIDYKVVGAMYKMTKKGEPDYSKPQSFYMYPRSSISKSNFRLANNVGIIDSGYRGSIGAYFDAAPWSNDEFTMEKGSRYVQLCHPQLKSFKVIIVNELFLLGEHTERGDGGFGSTGK